MMLGLVEEIKTRHTWSICWLVCTTVLWALKLLHGLVSEFSSSFIPNINWFYWNKILYSRLLQIFVLSYLLFWPQEEKLQEDIRRLNAELEERDAYIESRRTEIATLESHISQSREGFSHHKTQRDKLQNERKYDLCAFDFDQSYWNTPICLKWLTV